MKFLKILFELSGGRKKRSLINPVKVKRIFAVTTLTNDNKGHQYVTEKNQTMRELEVPPSISGNRKISVFVNPLSINSTENSNDSCTEDDVVLRKKNSGSGTNAAAAEVLRTARRFKKPEFSKGSTGSLDESLFESVDSSTPTTKLKDKSNEDAKNLNGEAGSSSLDSITNSLASSSPEITAANKSSQVRSFRVSSALTFWFEKNTYFCWFLKKKWLRIYCKILEKF